MSEIFVGPFCCTHNNLHGIEQYFFLLYIQSCTLLDTTEESLLYIQPQHWRDLFNAEGVYSPKSVGLLRGDIYLRKKERERERTESLQIYAKKNQIPLLKVKKNHCQLPLLCKVVVVQLQLAAQPHTVTCPFPSSSEMGERI